LQAVFHTWCRLAAQNRLPAWAVELQQNVRFLRQAQEPSTSPTSTDSPACNVKSDTPAASKSDRWKSWTIPVLICVASLFVHVLILAIQHGLRPLDSDGDGVQDTEDRCPSSAPSLHFRSSWRTDWDGDGCLDSVEDSDDDDDNIPDSMDLCPRTVLGAAVDKDGCAYSQLELRMRGGSVADQGGSSGNDATSSWKGKIAEVFAEGIVQTLLGTLLTAGLAVGWDPMKATVQQWKNRLFRSQPQPVSGQSAASQQTPSQPPSQQPVIEPDAWLGGSAGWFAGGSTGWVDGWVGTCGRS